MEYREALKQELESTDIRDYEAGDILELINSGHNESERFVAIVVKTNWLYEDEEDIERLGIYDLETDCIFEDLDNYKVVRKRSGFLQLTD